MSETWTVSDLAQAVKRTVEGTFGEVRVKGELSRITKHSSGHIYFDIKDEGAVIHAAWFRGAQKAAAVKLLEQGAEVVVSGRLSTYPARSEYQLIASTIELAGVGALLKLIEERKKKLAAEGLFDAARKKALPFLPRTIGIITSPTGAVIQDMLHRLRDRFLPQVLFWPVTVQGEDAADQVRAAIEGFQTFTPRPDVLIVARGGGSIEDLMPFNDEALVRAVAASAIPVISAIGHETDWTLIDLAADVRAPTPTGAAEFAVPVKADLLAATATLRQRLELSSLRYLRQQRLTLDGVVRGLGQPRSLLENMMQRLDERSLRLSHALRSWLAAHQLRLARLTPRAPLDQVGRCRQRLDERSLRLSHALEQWLQVHRLQLARLSLRAPVAQIDRAAQRLDLLARMMTAVSYQSVLERGFALVMDEAGHAVARAADAPEALQLRFSDGVLRVQKSV